MAQPTTNTAHMTLVPMMANMGLVNAQAQNQALMANNAANEQTQQTLESIQTAFQALTEENARLNARIETLQNELRLSRQQEEGYRTATANLTIALIKQMSNLDARCTNLETKYTQHTHVIDRGAVTKVNRSEKSKTFYNVPIKKTEIPLGEQPSNPVYETYENSWF